MEIELPLPLSRQHFCNLAVFGLYVLLGSGSFYDIVFPVMSFAVLCYPYISKSCFLDTIADRDKSQSGESEDATSSFSDDIRH